MCVEGGYLTVSPMQLAGVLGSYLDRRVSLRAVRVFFAALEMKAIRDAARRSRPRRVDKGCCYRLAEITRLTNDISERTARRELALLAEVGCLTMTDNRIALGDVAGGRAGELLSELACRRSFMRPIPIPRSALRFLARTKQKALMLTMIGYLVRGLSLKREADVVVSRGTIKVTWVSRVFGLSERAVRYARAELVRLGWIGKDTGSTQWKLNRDGAYFELNLAWGRGERRLARPRHSSTAVPGSAPRPAPKRHVFAPPYKRPVNYSVSKDQRTSGVPEGPAGVHMQQGGVPTLRDVRQPDLEHFSRTESLYLQAVAQRLIEPSEASFLNWVAAAVRARTAAARDPVRTFLGIVRGRLWHHITQADENRARQAIARYRYQRGPVPDVVAKALAA